MIPHGIHAVIEDDIQEETTYFSEQGIGVNREIDIGGSVKIEMNDGSTAWLPTEEILRVPDWE